MDLLVKDAFATINTRNLQILVTELFKVHNMPTELMQELFRFRQTYYNLRNRHHFAIASINPVYRGFESISNVGPIILKLMPNRLKELNNISSSKTEIKRWQP